MSRDGTGEGTVAEQRWRDKLRQNGMSHNNSRVLQIGRTSKPANRKDKFQATEVENSVVRDQTMKPGSISRDGTGEGTVAEQRWREKLRQSGMSPDDSRALKIGDKSTPAHVTKSKKMKRSSAINVEPPSHDYTNNSKLKRPNSVDRTRIAEDRWRKKVQQMTLVGESKSEEQSTPGSRELFLGKTSMTSSLEGNERETELMNNDTPALRRNNTVVLNNQTRMQSPGAVPVMGTEDQLADDEESFVTTDRMSDPFPGMLTFEAELSPDVEFGIKLEATDVVPIDDSPVVRKRRLCCFVLLAVVLISVGLAVGLTRDPNICEYKSNWSLVGKRIVREGIFGEVKVIAVNRASPITGAFGSAVSVSGNGERLAVARRLGDGFSIFELDDTGDWIQLGNDIRVQSIELEEDELGDPGQGAVVISGDGNRIAVGTPSYSDEDLERRGGVMVYELKDNEWVQIGKTLLGESAFGYLGDKNAVDLSEDGNAVAVGNSRSGCVRVYQLISGEWAQLGHDIEDDVEGSSFGESVSMSADGTVVSIGASGHSDRAGVVRVFKYSENGNWSQVGGNIHGGKGYCLFGWPISISSDASRLAVSSTSYLGGNTTCSDNDFGSDLGEVRVFDFSGGDWIQMGEGLVGSEKQESFGWAISLSGDGTTLAIGNSRGKTNGEDSGYSLAYHYTCGAWTQAGKDIIGATSHDWSGFSVSLSYNGERLAVGSPRDYGLPGNETVSVYGNSW